MPLTKNDGMSVVNVQLKSSLLDAAIKASVKKKKYILLVDDDPAIRQVLLHLLTEEGYVVLLAANGVEAVEFVSARQFDLVLLDLNMPLKDGWETFENLSSENPLLPIIVITARSNQLFPAVASGVGALMEKPLDLPKLLSTIRELLEEPAEVRRARMAGRTSEFHYIPPKANASDRRAS